MSSATLTTARLGRTGLDITRVGPGVWAIGGPWDYPVEEAWATLVALRDEGTIRFAGVSSFDADQLERCEPLGLDAAPALA